MDTSLLQPIPSKICSTDGHEFRGLDLVDVSHFLSSLEPIKVNYIITQTGKLLMCDKETKGYFDTTCKLSNNTEKTKKKNGHMHLAKYESNNQTQPVIAAGEAERIGDDIVFNNESGTYLPPSFESIYGEKMKESILNAIPSNMKDKSIKFQDGNNR